MDPQLDNVQRMREFGARSHIWMSLSSSSLLSWLRNLCRRWNRKIIRDGADRNTVFQIQQDWDKYELTEAMKACIRLQQGQAGQNPSSKKRKWVQSTMSGREATCSWYFLGEVKSVFSNGMSLGISTTLQGRPEPRNN